MSIKPLPSALYRSEEVRTLERLYIEQGGATGFELMQRAALALWQTLRQRYSKARVIAVFCGAGNNGGDGYLLASLAHEAGLDVVVYALGAVSQFGADAARAYQHYCQLGGKIASLEDTVNADVLVDALLGSGLNRRVNGDYASAIALMNAHAAPVLAVDSPSGLDTDTGNVLGCAVQADCTVTFVALKQGLFTGFAAHYCGEIVFADLNVAAKWVNKVNPTAWRVLREKLAPRARCIHKGQCGHVLVVGGDVGFSGAALLAAEAALRTGAGLVSIATHPQHAAFLNLHRPELMCRGVSVASELAPLLAKASVIVVGVGLGQSAWAVALFNAVLATDKPLVVDADGLNLLALNPHPRSNWVLTPHLGEAARLLQVSKIAVQQDRFASSQALQTRYGGVVLLKGAGTVIASEQHLSVSTTGNAGMATAGMGDVLAGVIASLMAQGLTLPTAAQQGAYLHGLAGDLAAVQGGERGLIASDLMPQLRYVVN